MTAEVAIINRFGIALAADSAVTIGDERVWKTTNKLFSLGPHHDIGIMIYGGGTFLGCPWDIIIKRFREKIVANEFKSLFEVVPEFLIFLSEGRWGTEEDDILSIVRLFVKEIDEYAASIEDVDNDDEAKQKLSDLIKSETKKISSKKVAYNIDKKQFVSNFKEYVEAISEKAFDFDIGPVLKRDILDYLFEYVVREGCESNHETGVVICGYGVDEIYPVLSEVFVDGRFNTVLRSWEGRSYDLNVERDRLATVVPFAQRDMTNIFMEGISHAFVQFFHTIIGGLLRRKSETLVTKLVAVDDDRAATLATERKINKNLTDEVFKAFRAFRQENAIQPLMSAIRSLPREEMAAMSEALVELTSLRRKMDSRVQSVAGPVDVAFISKGDGFVWMKRKLYFEGGLNDDYKLRKQKRLG